MIDTIDISYYTSPMAMGKRIRDRQPTMSRRAASKAAWPRSASCAVRCALWAVIDDGMTATWSRRRDHPRSDVELSDA